MKQKSSGPLTDKHLATLNKLIAACTETERFCKDCEECGLDVTPERRKNSEQLDIATKIKAKFFPTAK